MTKNELNKLFGDLEIETRCNGNCYPCPMCGLKCEELPTQFNSVDEFCNVAIRFIIRDEIENVMFRRNKK